MIDSFNARSTNIDTALPPLQGISSHALPRKGFRRNRLGLRAQQKNELRRNFMKNTKNTPARKGKKQNKTAGSSPDGETAIRVSRWFGVSLRRAQQLLVEHDGDLRSLRELARVKERRIRAQADLTELRCRKLRECSVTRKEIHVSVAAIMRGYADLCQAEFGDHSRRYSDSSVPEIEDAARKAESAFRRRFKAMLENLCENA